MVTYISLICVAVSSSLDHDQPIGQEQSASTEKLVVKCYHDVVVMTMYNVLPWLQCDRE